MKFFRSILGTTDPEVDSPDDLHETPSDREDPAEEAKHDLNLQREFSRGLSSLSQRQLQFEKYRWEPPGQTSSTSTVLAAVPVVFHSSMPVKPSPCAGKYRVLPTATGWNCTSASGGGKAW